MLISEASEVAPPLPLSVPSVSQRRPKAGLEAVASAVSGACSQYILIVSDTDSLDNHLTLDDCLKLHSHTVLASSRRGTRGDTSIVVGRGMAR